MVLKLLELFVNHIFSTQSVMRVETQKKCTIYYVLVRLQCGLKYIILSVEETLPFNIGVFASTGVCPLLY